MAAPASPIPIVNRRPKRDRRDGRDGRDVSDVSDIDLIPSPDGVMVTSPSTSLDTLWLALSSADDLDWHSSFLPYRRAVRHCNGMADFGDLDFMQRGRRFVVGLVMLGIGGVIGYALPQSNASPKSETGTVVTVDNATTNAGVLFEFKPSKGKKESFRLQDATPWQGTKSGKWHEKGQPSCLTPGSTTPVKATLGVVTARSVGSAPERSIVVWVE